MFSNLIGNISAINATTLEVTLSGTPVTAPAIADFAVTASINGGNATPVTPTAITMNGNVATLTLPEVKPTNVDQNITYSLSYLSGQVKTAQTVVAADPQFAAEKAAEDAVKAYEDATVSKYNDVKVAADLKTAATTAVTAVTNADHQAAFTARVTAKETAINTVLTEKVKAVTSATTQTALYNALNGFFADVNVDRIVEYTALNANAAVAKTTVQEIQVNVVWTANVVNSVNTATNEIAFANALADGMAKGVFTGYRADSVASYATNLAIAWPNPLGNGTRTSIQTAINTVNTNADNSADAIKAATDAVTALETEVAAAGNVTNLGAADGVNAHVTAANALIATAGNPASLLTRMTAVNDKVTVIQSVIAAEADITVAANYNAAQVNVLKLANSDLKTALQARLDSFANVVAMNGAANASAAQTLLTAQNPAGFANLSATSKTAVATAVYNAGADYTTKTAYNNAIADAVAQYTVVDSVNSANSEAALLEALKNGANTVLSNGTTHVITATITDANSPLYWAAHQGYDPFSGAAVPAVNMTTAANINTNVLTAMNTLVTTANTAVTTYETTPAGAGNAAAATAAKNALPKGQLANQMDARVKVVAAEQSLANADATAAKTAVNLLADGELKTGLTNRLTAIGYTVAMNAANNSTEAKTALDAQAPTGYASLTDAIKLAVATEVWNTGTDYASVTAYNTALAQAIRWGTVDNAQTAAQMKDALTAVAIAENTATFINLSTTGKTELAQLVLAAKPQAGYGSTANVVGAITAQNTARNNFLTAVNAAADISAMKTALDVAQLPAFQALTSEQKFDTAEKVLNALNALKAQTPAAQFTSITAVQQAAGL